MQEMAREEQGNVDVGDVQRDLPPKGFGSPKGMTVRITKAGQSETGQRKQDVVGRFGDDVLLGHELQRVGRRAAAARAARRGWDRGGTARGARSLRSPARS